MDITVSEDIDSEFLEVVRDILEDREFKKLNCFRQHLKTTRFMHSLNVSYISWCLARRFRCDARAAARAGLLHDFFLYDFRDKQPTRELQAFYHPMVAAYQTVRTTLIFLRRRLTRFFRTCSLWVRFQPAKRHG